MLPQPWQRLCAQPVDESATLDLSRPRRVHLVGAGGAGMSAIAVILAEMGHDVSGSESAALPVLERLRAAGVRMATRQDGSAIAADIDAVITSTAVPNANAEIQAARSLGVPVLHRSVAQAAMLTGRDSVAIAGSHGKTTTTAMLAHILMQLDPSSSAFLGAELQGGTNGWFRGGARFVMEADESDGTFRMLFPQIGVITNIEPDHLEHHTDFEGLVETFGEFLATNVQRLAILNGDDPNCVDMLGVASCATRTVGRGPSCNWRVTNEVLSPGSSSATLATPDGAAAFHVPVPGAHNVMNAAMALSAGSALGLDLEQMISALPTFPGVARRFTRIDRDDGVIVVDDYAHLPTEVAVTLEAARRLSSGPLIAVFQPHRYSRTASLAETFEDAFTLADETIITEVYAAGEAPRPGVSGQNIVDAILSVHPSASVRYLDTPDAVLERLRALAHPGAVVALMGAGDIGSWGSTW